MVLLPAPSPALFETGATNLALPTEWSNRQEGSLQCRSNTRDTSRYMIQLGFNRVTFLLYDQLYVSIRLSSGLPLLRPIKPGCKRPGLQYTTFTARSLPSTVKTGLASAVARRPRIQLCFRLCWREHGPVSSVRTVHRVRAITRVSLPTGRDRRPATRKHS